MGKQKGCANVGVERSSPMDNNELLNELLGIPELYVLKSDFIGEEKLHLMAASMLPVAGCPDCGRVSNRCMMRVKSK
jgi:hypothetical protein